MRIVVITGLFIIGCMAPAIVRSQDNTCLRSDTLPVIHFQKKSTSLSKKNKQVLDAIIVLTKKCPDYTLVIMGEPTTCNPKYSARAWDRVNKAIDYMAGKGVSTEKMIFSYQQDGEYGMLRFRWGFEGEEITGSEPPHPNLLKKN